jgi:hypothetical protein
MKVSDLLTTLKRFDPNTDVVFAYDYGDRGQTMVVKPVKSVDVGSVAHSNYHGQSKLIDVDDDRVYDDVRDVVVLK